MSKILSSSSTRALLQFLLALLFSLPLLSFAQLADPNDEGVSMGHLHFQTADLSGSQAFWEAMGADLVQNGPLNMYGIPGVLILLREGEPSSGSVGTIINHIGFHVPDVNLAFEAWSNAGINVERGGFPGQLWVNGPDELRIEILENPSINNPVQMHHIHWNISEAADIPAMQSWYDNMFGATPGIRANFQAGDIPGVNLTYSASEISVIATQGTVLDHIGFEVTDLRAAIARLEAAGITMDSGYREIPAANLSIAFFTDPWGTYVELTQGLEP